MRCNFLLLAFLPLSAFAEFNNADSSNLALIEGHTYNILQSLGLGGNGGSSSLLSHSSSIDSTSQNIYNIVNGEIRLGSQAVYDFLGGSSTVSFPAIDSLRVLSSTSPDLAPSYNLWSYQSQSAPDFKTFLHGFVNRQFPLMYSLSSGVSDLDARAWRLQNQGAYITNSLSRGIGSSWTYAAWPSISTLLSSPYDALNSNPLNFAQYAQSVPFAPSPDFTSSGVNFWKWYVEKYSATRDLYDSSSLLQDRAYYNIATNYFDFVRRYDSALSNLVEGIRSDNKKTSDVFSNLWARDFHVFANIAQQQFRNMSAANAENIDLASLNITSQPLGQSSQDSFSHKVLWGFSSQNRVLVSINNFLYNSIRQLQDVRSKLASLPSAISSALSSLDVTIDNPSVNVTVDNFSDLVISNSSSLSWHYDTSLVRDGFQIGPVWSDLTPSSDKDIDTASVNTFLAAGLTGNLNDDIPVLLQLMIKQHGNNNAACFSILTNVQTLVGINRDINSKLDQDDDEDDEDDYSEVEEAKSTLDGYLEEFAETKHEWDYNPSQWSAYARSGGILDYMANNARWHPHVQIDLSFFHTGSSSVVGSFDWGDVSGSAMIYDLDISAYKWFFDIMRCCSILGVWYLIFKLVMLFLRYYIKMMVFFTKIVCGALSS